MNIRKQTLTLLAVALLLSAPARMNAQVSIGADEDPQNFSLLELIGNNSNGLRLPQMNSTQINGLKNTISNLPAIDKPKAKGLTVMNTTTNCMEIYNGSDWRNLCDPLKFDASQTTAILYGYTSTDPYNRGYGIDVSTQIANGQVNLTNLKIAYTKSLGKLISSYTSNEVNGLTLSYSTVTLNESGDIPLTLSGTPTKRGAFDIPVEIDGETVQVRIHVGCGMYVGDYSRADNYLLMMCINWGTSTHMNWSTDPFNPTKGSNGDYFQWGRKAAVAEPDATSETWPGVSPGYQLEIPTFYNKSSETAPVKDQEHDPCPSGWRMPTRSEWVAGLNTTKNCTVSRSGYWLSNPNEYGPIMKISPKGLPASIVTLGLPAAGYWSSESIALSGHCRKGYYWSSTEANSTDGICLNFTDALLRPGYENNKSDGSSLRCVAE